jgi:hypothetical protein
MITCYVLVAGKRDGERVYGPFEDEKQADRWALLNLPVGVIFQIVPVFDTVQS